LLPDGKLPLQVPNLSMAINDCIFCGDHLASASRNRPNSRTAEHVFAEWFRRVSNHKIMNMYLGNVDGTNPQLMRRPPLTALTMKGVCKQCNNGWMSSLETAVEPIMLAGVRTHHFAT
jgi:hypothetical protein